MLDTHFLGAQMGLVLVALLCICICAPVRGDKECNGFKHLENGRMFFRHGGLLVFFSCNPGYKLHGDEINICTSGHWNHDPPVCVDINECQEEKCEWQCVNLPGSYRCTCPRGYTLRRDGRRCKDINECSQNNGGCSHRCVNKKGRYKCACPASHRRSFYSWKKCVLRSTANTAD